MRHFRGLSRGRKAFFKFRNKVPLLRQAGFSLVEIMVGGGVLMVLLLAVSSAMQFSNRAVMSTKASTDFNSLVNTIQGVLNNATTCVAALKDIPLDPGGSYPPAGTMGTLTAITTGGASPTSIVTTGPQNGAALKVTQLQLSQPALIGTTGNQYLTTLSLVAAKVVGGAIIGAVGSQTMSHPFQLVVTLNPGSTPAYKITGCSGLNDSLWQKVGGVGPDIYYSPVGGGNVGIGTTAPVFPFHVQPSLANMWPAHFQQNTDGYGITVGNRPTTTTGEAILLAYNTTLHLALIQGWDYSGGGSTPLSLQGSGGNVGIGTTAPFAKLQSEGATTPYNLDSGLISAQVSGTAKRVNIGYDTTIDAGYLQSVDSGTGNKALLFNANGGNVGIGTWAPATTLNVSSTFNGGVPKQALFESAGYEAGINFHKNKSGSQGFSLVVGHGTLHDSNFRIVNDSNSGDMLVVSPSGNTGIGVSNPAYLLQLAADSAAKPGSSTWTIASDARLKDIRASFDRGLEALEGINPIYFRYKRQNALGLPSDKEYVGIIAQDAQKAVPEAVRTDAQGYLHVTNDAIIWTILNSVKELYHKAMDRFDTQERSIASTQGELTQIKAESADLKAKDAAKDKKIHELEEENAEIKARLEKIEKSLRLKRPEEPSKTEASPE